MPSLKLQRESRTINARRTGTSVYEMYHVTNGGAPLDPNAAVDYVRSLFPVDTPHPHPSFAADNCVVEGVDLVRIISPSKVRIAVIYQTRRLTIGGLTTKSIRTRSEAITVPVPTLTTLDGIGIPAVPVGLGVQRTRKWMQRSYYVGAYGESNLQAVEAAENDYAGRMCVFPLPPSQQREPVPWVFSSAGVQSDSENRLFATYTFWTLLPKGEEEVVANPADTPVVLPALDYLDDYAPGWYFPAENQYQVGLRPRGEMYGDVLILNSNVLPGVQG